MRNIVVVLLALSCYKAVADTDDKKWVWASRRNDGGKRLYTGITNTGSGTAAALVPPQESLFQPFNNDDNINSQSTKLRYEVSEPGEFGRPPPRPNNRPQIYPEDQYRPTTSTINGYRPDNFRPGSSYRPDNSPINNNRPIHNHHRPSDDSYRPYPSENGYRPTSGSGHRPSLGPGYRPTDDSLYRPGGDSGYRPSTGSNGRPILIGPTPSWEHGDDHRYKDYDRCKCVHAFNCNSPGIKFGSCDVDKQYCCYNEVYGGNHPSIHHGNVRDKDRPILAGPGGPTDRPGLYKPIKGRPHQVYDSNRYSNNFKESHSSHDGLDEAYKRGLESAIHETFQRPSRFDGRKDYSSYSNYNHDDSFNRRPRPNHKYGLYEPSFDYYRSANTTIEAEDEKKV